MVVDGSKYDVLLVGLGYVGVTLAAAMLDSGYRVIGYEVRPASARLLAGGTLPFAEPGVEELLQKHIDRELAIVTTLDGLESVPPAVVICVGTPTHPESHEPDLSQLRAALATVGPHVRADTLVVIRSTVPIGTCAGLVTDLLSEYVDKPLVASCPERTIQGSALAESVRLPQIVGAASPEAQRRAEMLFGKIAPRVVPVSSTEAAEAVKLICNAHTDVIYGFGNEVALFAEHIGLDARELICAANLDYPRPDLHQPGYVGGSCLTKDPYLLAASVAPAGYHPNLILAARRLNEETPRASARRVVEALWLAGVGPEAKIVVSGLAYKGMPECDDVRGSSYPTVLEVLRDSGVTDIVCHDFMLGHKAIEDLGLVAAELREGSRGAHALMVLNNHPGYRTVDFGALVAQMAPPALIYDAWRVVELNDGEVNVMRLGRA